MNVILELYKEVLNKKYDTSYKINYSIIYPVLLKHKYIYEKKKLPSLSR